MASNGGSSKLKLFGALILFAGGIGFVYIQYRGNTAAAISQPAGERQQFRSAGAAPGAPSTQRNQGPRSEEDRDKFRQEMEKDLNLTPEQKVQFDALRKKNEGKTGPESWQAGREEMDKILTPEQKTKAREAMMGRMKARMAERMKSLPPDEQAAFMKKLEERMKNGPPGGFRGGPGDGPPRDGGGPGGPR